MTCDFSFAHFREILAAASAGGYRFGLFESLRAERELILRHDVDYSPERALRIATIEAELGVQANFFFLLRSPFYNVFDPRVARIVHAIAAQGHQVGLHAVAPGAGDDLRAIEKETLRELDLLRQELGMPMKVVSFHNPPSTVFGWPSTSFVNAYAPEYFQSMRYLSDSNQRWREGCPCAALRAGRHPRLQILFHPDLWGDEPGDVVARLDAAVRETRAACQAYLAEHNTVFALRQPPGAGSLTIVVPAFNEVGGLADVVQETVAEAERAGLDFEVIVVDDGSDDGTGRVAERLASDDVRVRVRRHEHNEGLGRALRTGFLAAAKAYVTWLPSDGQFRAADVIRMAAEIGDADIIVGDVLPAARIAADSVWKLVMSRGLRLALRLVAGPMVTYTGLLLFRREVLSHVTLSSTTGVANFELINHGRRAGAVVRRASFPVAFASRTAGHSKVANVRTILRHLHEVYRLRRTLRARQGDR